MTERPKGQIQNARLTGVEVVMRNPIGIVDMEYREVFDGKATGLQQTLRLLLTSDECRDVSRQLTKLATAIEYASDQKEQE